jgi:hypothetical protein
MRKRSSIKITSVVWSPTVLQMGSENILIWNVRGLNANCHRDAMHHQRIGLPMSDRAVSYQLSGCAALSLETF